jgi:hypothetical protein
MRAAFSTIAALALTRLLFCDYATASDTPAPIATCNLATVPEAQLDGWSAPVEDGRNGTSPVEAVTSR